MKWSELSMTQKADVISMAVKAGMRDLDSIKSFYNESVGSRRFDDGGGLSSLPSNWTMQDEAKYRNWRENLPVNLKNTNDNDYDMRRAYLADMQPSLEDDGYYHLGSRDPKTGRILKAPHHPTYLQAINTDARIGYYPTIDKQGVTYTDTWKGNKYEMGGPKRDRMPAHPRRGNEEKDPEAIAAYQQYELDMAERRKVSAERAKQYIEEKARRNIEAAKELNRRKDIVMSQLEDEASSIPFTGQEIQQAAEEQRQEKLDEWENYKKGINATITAAELGLSGASLLGAYANWKNWATAGNATKQAIANLLQKAQFPMQVAGTAIDSYQTYDALQNNDDSNAIYNGISTGLGITGSLGAANIFPARMDRALDVMGIIQNSGDFIKYGYDSMFGNKKAEGGPIHIAPSKKGTFTAAASKHGKSVQEFASQVLAHKENYSPAMVKKANFARNASKWKHGLGGNLYGGGGMTSLISIPLLPSVEEIRSRLYNGVNPAGYRHIPERIWDALNGKEANKSIYRDDQWATYLQIPEEERHHGVEKLKPARYKPSKGASEGDIYRVTLNNEDTDSLIESVKLLGLNIGENTVDRSLDKYFGNHTIGRGYDKKGEYVSYYDKYDLNPFAGGTPIKTGVRKVDKWLRDNTSNIDMSMGIGKPFEIYDRIYLDDYYGVPKEARGATFLPEVIVTGKKKKAFGGNLFPTGGLMIKGL